jgi:CheY-like chemotaxis protein
MTDLPPRVLIVEDELLVRDLMAHELRHAGFEVLDAGTAESALLIATELDRLDLLFTDIRLPGKNGWLLAEEIRARHADVPVIYASGYAERMTLVPRSRFLQKPYLPSQVLRTAAELGIKLPAD